MRFLVRFVEINVENGLTWNFALEKTKFGKMFRSILSKVDNIIYPKLKKTKFKIALARPKNFG